MSDGPIQGAHWLNGSGALLNTAFRNRLFETSYQQLSVSHPVCLDKTLGGVAGASFAFSQGSNCQPRQISWRRNHEQSRPRSRNSMQRALLAASLAKSRICSKSESYPEGCGMRPMQLNIEKTSLGQQKPIDQCFGTYEKYGNTPNACIWY